MNILPHTSKTLDVFTIIIKWSKTIQNNIMLSAIPGSPNDPLFQIPKGRAFILLTDSTARKHLKKVCKILRLRSPLTFHLFRKSGTTWIFQHGVSIQDIMTHGTWTSDCFWCYVSTLPQHLSPVTATFKQHLHI